MNTDDGTPKDVSAGSYVVIPIKLLLIDSPYRFDDFFHPIQEYVRMVKARGTADGLRDVSQQLRDEILRLNHEHLYDTMKVAAEAKKKKQDARRGWGSKRAYRNPWER